MPARNKDTLDQVYSLIANEEDARVCTDIPDEACREVPRNFFLILGAAALIGVAAASGASVSPYGHTGAWRR